jgi:hypothetical protein
MHSVGKDAESLNVKAIGTYSNRYAFERSRYNDWLDALGSIPGRGKIFLFSRSAQGPTQPPVQWVLGGDFPGREADQSQSSSGEVRNGGSYTSTPPYVFMA